MARIFKTPFGAQGDTEQVPEAPQGDGSVSLTQGFGYDYEREYEDPAAKDIRREVMNGLFHDITEAVGDIQLTGVAKWDSDAAPYPAGALVWHNNNAWRSMVGNNSVAPTEGANWSAVAPHTVSQSEAQAGTATTRRAWTAQRVRQAITAWWNTMAGTGGSQFRTNAENDDRFLQKSTANDNSYIRVSRSTGVAAYFNRAGGGGSIADFEYDGNTVATIRTDGQYTGNINLADVNSAGSMAGLNAGTGGTSFRNNSQNDSRFAFNARTISAGTGLTGGGDLSDNRTLSLGNHSADLITSGTLDADRLPSGQSIRNKYIEDIGIASVGGMLFLFPAGTGDRQYTPGTTLSGSSLNYASGSPGAGWASSPNTGTYMALGRGGSSSAAESASLWIRIS